MSLHYSLWTCCNSSWRRSAPSYGSKFLSGSSGCIDVPSGSCIRRTSQKKGLSSNAPVRCAGSPRWTLDDVERISRGRASKAKTGSRSVPHRLNADERKAFELAKKRGFVVQQVNTRRYPLINSHRNYCDALGIPCIRIDQGCAGEADVVVMDLTPPRLPEADLRTLRDIVLKAVASIPRMNNQAVNSSVGHEIDQTSDIEDCTAPGESLSGEIVDLKSSNATDVFTEPLRFEASTRSLAKVIAQTGVDAWQDWSKSSLKPVA